MFEALGLGGAYGVMCAIVAVCALILTVAIHFIAPRPGNK